MNNTFVFRPPGMRSSSAERIFNSMLNVHASARAWELGNLIKSGLKGKKFPVEINGTS